MTATTITPEQIAALAAGAGPYWFLRSDNGTPYAVAEQSPEAPADTYLLRASAAWLAQWNGDWQKAADQINYVLTKQEGDG